MSDVEENDFRQEERQKGKHLEKLIEQSRALYESRDPKKRAEDLEKMLLSFPKDDGSYCQDLTKRRVIFYPQLHQTAAMENDRIAMDMVAFSQWRILKFIASHPDLEVFRESLCDEAPLNQNQGAENLPNRVARLLFRSMTVPSKFEDVTSLQRNFLYEEGGVLTAFYLGLISTVHSTTTSKFCEKWDAKMMGPVGPRIFARVQKEREYDAAVRIEKYLDDHPSKRALLVFGANHDFSEYFDRSEYCKVNPNETATYPGYNETRAPKTVATRKSWLMILHDMRS